MQSLKRSLVTAKRLYDSQGLKGISSGLKQKKSDFVEWLFTTDQFQWCLGKFVELRGNMVRIEKMSFSVDSPAISTKMKSHFLFDAYENTERAAINQFLSADLPIIELGGAVGVVACHANKMLRNPQQHVVIEANPELLPLLEENRDRNGCRFTILHRAVAYGSDEIAFHVNIDFWASNVNTSTDRFVKVPTISLQEVFEQFGFERCTLICDIEGGEIDLVQHEAEILKQRVATFVVEVHPWCIQADIIDAMLHGLEIIGFTCVYGRDNNYVLHNMAYHQKEA